MVVERAVAASTARCPGCESVSARVGSRYRRHLADAAVAGRAMTLRLVVRRFFCPNISCAAKTFAEQVDGLTVRWSRRTNQLTSMLTAIGVALGGRAGEPVGTPGQPGQLVAAGPRVARSAGRPRKDLGR